MQEDKELQDDQKLNWTRIYFLILLFNSLLVVLFYLLRIYYNDPVI